MLFWIMVLVGILFAVAMIRKGFFTTWAILFNIIISIYLGVMLEPAIIEILPDVGNSGYHHAICLLVIAILSFTILQTIAVTFLIGTYEVTFPQIVNSIGSGLLGFISGYLVCGFVLFVLCVGQFSNIAFVEKICGQGRVKAVAKGPVVKVCSFVAAVSFQDSTGNQEVIDGLLSTEYEIEPEAHEENDELEAIEEDL